MEYVWTGAVTQTSAWVRGKVTGSDTWSVASDSPDLRPAVHPVDPAGITRSRRDCPRAG